ncbi:MAG TPA: bifunctional 5,10-methylenetetrahydrofolate dehydrogenase/5,10-methenyltetrahydrofolate cyclohydrolase [Candidatus Paceibacterota bacterium]|nr:bifunctional 5,10-methylenetetrahydrofolate dehydrogenase/5,10-methenyltetrahydrofolate cyclohydrolase [Candidatus Paceibacterota bacterium]
MRVDGKAIAEEMRAALAKLIAGFPCPPVLAILEVGDDPVIASFVRMKQRFGESVGAVVQHVHLEADASKEEILAAAQSLAGDPKIDGVIVQLPLPAGIDAGLILDAIPPEKDVDVLGRASVARFASGTAPVLPPVAGAILEILERNNVRVFGKDALVVGAGKLVGAPAAILLRHNHARVTVVDRPIERFGDLAREADIIVLGTGQPGLLTPDMIGEETIVIDAGTSESNGKVVGDADPLCESRAALFTPVPGGVGPITIAGIFKNLCVLAVKRMSSA